MNTDGDIIINNNMNFDIMDEMQQKVSSDGWVSDIWAPMDEEAIHPASIHPCITGTAVAQGVKHSCMHKRQYHSSNKNAAI
jgi:hypothetical protein